MEWGSFFRRGHEIDFTLSMEDRLSRPTYKIGPYCIEPCLGEQFCLSELGHTTFGMPECKQTSENVNKGIITSFPKCCLCYFSPIWTISCYITIMCVLMRITWTDLDTLIRFWFHLNLTGLRELNIWCYTGMSRHTVLTTKMRELYRLID